MGCKVLLQWRGLITGLLAAGLGLGAARAADSVLLKDGTVLEGEVVEDRAGGPEITLHLGTRKLSLARDTIRQVSTDKVVRAEYQRRAGALKPEDAEGHCALGQWCQTRKLHGMAEAEFQAALRADPQNAEARRALGLEAAAADAVRKTGAAEQNAAFVATAAPAQTEKDSLTRKITDSANVLGLGELDEQSRQEAIRALLQERDKAGDILLACLDYRSHTEARTRLGALKAMRVVKPAGPRVAPALAWSAVMDPEEEVRMAAVDTVKQRKDDEAVGVMMRHLLSAFDEKGNVVSAPVRDAAVSALRRVDDRRVAEGLLRYCTMELRPALTEQRGDMERVLLRVPMFVNVGGATFGYIVILPIQFPNLDIVRVRTTVCAPAAALRALTGQDFGADTNAWLSWIRSH